MYLIAIGWAYVVLMMAVAEAISPNGSLLGALMTLLLYGVLPLSIVLYIAATPHRRRARQAAESAAEQRGDPSASAAEAPDGGGEPAGLPVAPVRKEP